MHGFFSMYNTSPQPLLSFQLLGACVKLNCAITELTAMASKGSRVGLLAYLYVVTKEDVKPVAFEAHDCFHKLDIHHHEGLKLLSAHRPLRSLREQELQQKQPEMACRNLFHLHSSKNSGGSLKFQFFGHGP